MAIPMCTDDVMYFLKTVHNYLQTFWTHLNHLQINPDENGNEMQKHS